MSCETCAQRLDVTLWGMWLQTVCKACQPMGPGCPSFRLKSENNSQPTTSPADTTHAKHHSMGTPGSQAFAHIVQALAGIDRGEEAPRPAQESQSPEAATLRGAGGLQSLGWPAPVTSLFLTRGKNPSFQPEIKL
ncbi:hypothetical protein [Aquabacterium sp.]|jgi:hypothetical protein|uniref:hypothetical protein n=1 Tax=Aquabacterium sp. TaxID=1872578 RepID=UPI0024895001|nr:hypothetical protein [Aquabacterium sp.]MDI1348757.1 hypothetical protein [Aquabacterium sp.]